MLVLSRKPNEQIVIDGGITITVIKTASNQIRIGIEAPDHVRIYRAEIWDKLQAQARAAQADAAG